MPEKKKKKSLTLGLILWNALLALALTCPWWMAKFHLYRRDSAYLSLPASERSFPYLYNQIFQETGDLDAVFLGSSIMWAAIDTEYVQSQLSLALGRPAKVRTLAWNWLGVDFSNIVLSDLLEHRRVKQLFIYTFTELENQSAPHGLMSYYGQYEDFARLSPGLPWLSRLQLYGTTVMGAPRHLYNLARPPQWAPDADLIRNLGSVKQNLGLDGAPFVRRIFTPPTFAGQDLVYSAQCANEFKFGKLALSDYDSLMLRRLFSLARQQGTRISVLHIPRIHESTQSKVEERLFWPTYLSTEVPMVGISPRRLFAGLSDKEIRLLFYNDHLNANGNEFFTRAISPGLIKVFLDGEHSHGTNLALNRHPAFPSRD